MALVESITDTALLSFLTDTVPKNVCSIVHHHLYFCNKKKSVYISMNKILTETSTSHTFFCVTMKGI